MVREEQQAARSASTRHWCWERMALFICLREGDCRVEVHRLLKLDIDFEALGEPGCVQDTLLH